MNDRYDAVIHMVTAADGAPKFYDLANVARTETLEEAIQRDLDLRGCYRGHQEYHIVDNRGNFEQKVKTTLNIAQSILGLPTNNKFFKKYLIKKNSDLFDPDIALRKTRDIGLNLPDDVTLTDT